MTAGSATGAERWLALMPLRGGSRGIPDKNLRDMAGRPLFAWALEQAVASECFNEICVSSDSERIRDRVRGLFGTAVTVLERSAASATDQAATEQVMLEVADQRAFDVMALVQATSPLTRAEDFRAARRRFEDDGLDSLVTGVPSSRFVWSDAGEPLNYAPQARPRRQDMAPSLVENGAFYFTRRNILLTSGCRLGGRIGVHPMAVETLVEIDEPADWPLVEDHLVRRIGAERLAAIRLLVVDVDGTLTDGGMYYDGSGERLKRFDTRDARGLAMLAAAGIRVCVVTGERSPAVDARMSKLGIQHYFSGVDDKWDLLESRLAVWGVSAAQAAVIGDDEGDVELMHRLGFSFCPADAAPPARSVARYVCRAGGGHGAVREVCELLLDSRR